MAGVFLQYFLFALCYCVVCADGSRSTTNLSLDELFAQLDDSYFFRANRQFIISIASINKIVKYGNNQLKIIVNPGSEISILISKNRAAQFKKWLNHPWC